jgi:UDP-N-acetylbacillosamine N-acetyltransferase
MTGMKKVVVYGASGHGKVVADIVLGCKDLYLEGFVDDNDEKRSTTLLGLPVFGDGVWLHNQAKGMELCVALGVGDNAARQRIGERCWNWGIEVLTLVHPTASVSGLATLGPGTVVMAQAAINACALTGSGVIVNTGAVVEHDVKLGEFSHVSPNAAMAGASTLGRLSHLGIGANVIECVNIGSNTIVGAGAVVTRDVPDNAVAFGIPARVSRSR